MIDEKWVNINTKYAYTCQITSCSIRKSWKTGRKMVNAVQGNFQKEPKLWQNENGSHYACVCELQIYMKEETKKGLYFKFHQNRSMRSLRTMRAFVNLVWKKMASSWWLVSSRARNGLRAVADNESAVKNKIVYKTSYFQTIYRVQHIVRKLMTWRIWICEYEKSFLKR